MEKAYKISSKKKVNKTSWHDLSHRHQVVFIKICNFVRENLINKDRCYFLTYLHKNYVKTFHVFVLTENAARDDNKTDDEDDDLSGQYPDLLNDENPIDYFDAEND